MHFSSFESTVGRLLLVFYPWERLGQRNDCSSLSFIAPSLGSALFISDRDTANKLFSHRVNSVFPRLRQINTN